MVIQECKLLGDGQGLDGERGKAEECALLVSLEVHARRIRRVGRLYAMPAQYGMPCMILMQGLCTTHTGHVLLPLGWKGGRTS